MVSSQGIQPYGPLTQVDSLITGIKFDLKCNPRIYPNATALYLQGPPKARRQDVLQSQGHRLQGSYCAGVVAALHSARTSSGWRPTNNAFTHRSGFLGKFAFPTCELRRHAGRSDAPAVRASSGESVDVETVQIGVVEEILSGEWPENFSILNFEDLSAHLEPLIFKSEAQPSTFLAEVMSKTIYTASPEQLLEEIDHHFANISGLPVIDHDLKCIGVLSKKDRERASNGLRSKVGEVMSSPVITLSADKTVLDAAVLMLKNKIHRIPIVNEGGQVVGIVTRTDIFHALEGISV